MSESDGLIIVRDFRSRSNAPNENPAIGTVGPNHVEGFGDTHVMYPADNPPMDVQAWSGWPVNWDTPLWNGATNQHNVSTLWTCVDLNTRQLASFPTYGMRGIDLVKLPEWANNPEPSVYSDWVEAAKQVFNTYQVSGEVILWAVGRYGLDNTGPIARWVVLNPAFVNIERSDGVIEYKLGNTVLDNADVLHIKYQTVPGNLRGISPISWAAQSIMSAASLEQMSTDLANRAGIPWGVIKHPRKLNSAESTELKNAWVSAARDRRGAPAILSGGMELETLTLSPRDMALLDLRIFDETRIAAALGVPPFLVGLPQPEGLTYANAQSLFDFHWRATLRPMAHTIASAMSNWLLPRGTRLEFNRDEYTRAPMKERAETYAILFNLIDEHGNRAMTNDEIRMAERFVTNAPVSTAQADMEAANL